MEARASARAEFRVSSESNFPSAILGSRPASIAKMILNRLAFLAWASPAFSLVSRESPPLAPEQAYDPNRAPSEESLREFSGDWLFHVRTTSCPSGKCIASCCDVLRCVAMCCDVLRCVAMCCKVASAAYSSLKTKLRSWRCF